MRGYDKRMTDYLNARFTQLGESVDRGSRNIAYIYGHTHSSRAPYAPRVDIENLTAANTGAWQRLIAPEIVKKRYSNRNEVLTKLQLADLPPCYSAIWIKLTDDRTVPLNPLLVYWRFDKDKERWSFTRSCEERE